MNPLLAYLIVVILLVAGCGYSEVDQIEFRDEDTKLTNFKPDSIIYKRPEEIENQYPSWLILRKKHSYSYESLHNWSCWTKTIREGEWRIYGDTLFLYSDIFSEDLKIIDPIDKDTFARYKIDGNRLNVLGINDMIFPGFAEPELIGNYKIKQLIDFR